MLHAGERPQMPPGVPVEMVDLSKEKPDVAAAYSLLRRYIFEYRRDLAVPLVLLIDGESRVRKVYAEIPPTATMRADLGRMNDSHALALPFPGKYYLNPRRNYFKLGAAFYWAGYPERALPYLEETLHVHPANWKALQAVARIQMELERSQDALPLFPAVD